VAEAMGIHLLLLSLIPAQVRSPQACPSDWVDPECVFGV
jgi:hypothetical protein